MLTSLWELVHQPGFDLSTNVSSVRRNLQTSLEGLTGVPYNSNYLDGPAKSLVEQFKRQRCTAKKFLQTKSHLGWMATIEIKVFIQMYAPFKSSIVTPQLNIYYLDLDFEDNSN